jgi:hypothetical protein
LSEFPCPINGSPDNNLESSCTSIYLDYSAVIFGVHQFQAVLKFYSSCLKYMKIRAQKVMSNEYKYKQPLHSLFLLIKLIKGNSEIFKINVCFEQSVQTMKHASLLRLGNLSFLICVCHCEAVILTEGFIFT